MSKTFRIIFIFLTVGIFACGLPSILNGQEMTVTITVTGTIAEVDGRFGKPQKKLALLNEYAGISGLSDRVSDVRVADVRGNSVSAKRFSFGEYVADAEFVSWNYRVDLKPLSDRTATAHASWIGPEHGLLMLGDLLPVVTNDGSKASAKVKFVLPSGWLQMENRIDDTVVTTDAKSEVVAIGKNIRFRKVHTNGTALTICIAGEWLFTSDDINNMARDVYAQTRVTFGADHAKEVFVNVFPFPQNVARGEWQAETRGRNITMISSDMAFKSQSLQRLHEQLRHEMFHLWLPNGVNLTGNYDWFYEGFALYQSLKLGVAVNRLRFDDYLDSMSRAFVIDGFKATNEGLIEISKKRFSGSGTQLYARGMIVAFLCDLAMLAKSKGKISSDNLVREIYQKHSLTAPSESAETAILNAMRAHPELIPITDSYVVSAATLDTAEILSAAGLELDGKTLRVVAKPSGRQKDLLDKLGYNNWRKTGTR